ncbi:MAG: hypothetical protein E6Q97_00810 [Desulfurellales bacterium]|nr:MAG: hypothetical protein E6Q97_00810 [Desulfurellales bacterium]
MKPFMSPTAAPEATAQPGSSYMLDQGAAWKQINPVQKMRMRQKFAPVGAGQAPQNLPGQMNKPMIPQQGPGYTQYQPKKPIFGQQAQSPLVAALMGG